MPTSPEAGPRVRDGAAPLVLRQHNALFVWAFAVFWCGGVVVGTVLLLRDGLPADATTWTLAGFALFWLFGVGLMAYVLGQSIVTLRLWPDGRAELVRRWPLKREVTSLRVDEMAVHWVADKDGDGDPYWRVQVSAGATLPPVSVAEGSRTSCDEAHRRLLAAGVRNSDLDGDLDGDPDGDRKPAGANPR